jgi:hypothetical protein
MLPEGFPRISLGEGPRERQSEKLEPRWPGRPMASHLRRMYGGYERFGQTGRVLTRRRYCTWYVVL